ncbi:hypothetical protein C4D60_Mb04t07100 [Musa balbisiana]|uniref:Uncharacterized protein n=1 Tax=Musa balbisiana TaxID=52838 RepID=A0A4S8KA88_MUSBA|nr:hypothetical protein C4D60_Mb04t07100 [Musa balbisiana]
MSILCAGILLLVKVIVEGYVKGVAGLWSLNMRERVMASAKSGSVSSFATRKLELIGPEILCRDECFAQNADVAEALQLYFNSTRCSVPHGLGSRNTAWRRRKTS